jgi:hypothetical protein
VKKAIKKGHDANPTSVQAGLGLGLGLWIPLILLSQQGMVLENGSYDFIQKREKGIILYSWLPNGNLSSENGEFEKKKFLKFWRILGPFFPPKILSICQKHMCQVKILIKTR